jgi:hypothetical protein
MSKTSIVLLIFLSSLESFFLIAYLLVWLSGEFDTWQYIDCLRVFVTAGMVLSAYAYKIVEEDLFHNGVNKG